MFRKSQHLITSRSNLQKLMTMASPEQNPICCPEFDPIPWDDKTFSWNNKLFIKDRVCTLFYMPLNFGSVMKRLDQLVTASGATIPDNICLSDHKSQWSMDLFLAVDKKVQGTEMTELSGDFYSRVYEGPFRDTKKWCNDFEEKAFANSLSIRKQYMWYTTCPKCAKKYGKNYVVIIGLIE